MELKQKNKIISIITFITHLIISIVLIGLGWVGISWENSWGAGENLTTEYFIIIAGVLLFLVSLYMLFNYSLKAYTLTIMLTLNSVIVWVVVEGSVDALLILPIYMVVFIPLTIYKHKLNKY